MSIIYTAIEHVPNFILPKYNYTSNELYEWEINRTKYYYNNTAEKIRESNTEQHRINRTNYRLTDGDVH